MKPSTKTTSTTRVCKRSVIGMHKRKRTVLPGDLLIDILLRIPAGRLAEFRRVSKFFRRLIDSPEFIQEHYDRWIKTRPSLMIQGSNTTNAFSNGTELPESPEFTEFLVDYDSAKSQVTGYTFIIPDTKFAKKKKIPNFINGWETSTFVGCCRGILCYNIINQNPREKKSCLVFWNPLTRAYRRSVEHDDSPIPGSSFTGSPTYFLGYNAVADDLKVLKMTCFTHSRGGDDRVYDFSVYSSKMDSWRMVEAGIFFNGFSSDDSHVFVEGTNSVHMLVSDDDALRILAFDFASEKFSLKVPLPQQCSDVQTTVSCIADGKEREGLLCLDGCLCFYRNPGRDRLEVWMMKEYGVRESWTRLFSLRPSHERPFYKKLVPRAFVDYKGRRKMLVSSTDPMMAGLYLCEGKGGGKEEKEDVKEFFHILKQHLRWTYLKPQHFEYVATRRKP